MKAVISLEELRKEYENIIDPETVARHDTWLETRPESVQQLAEKYPFNKIWRVKEGAPYGMSYPGAIGGLISYFEDGSVSFQVLVNTPEQFVPPGIRHQMNPAWLEEITWEDVEEAYRRLATP